MQWCTYICLGCVCKGGVHTCFISILHVSPILSVHPRLFNVRNSSSIVKKIKQLNTIQLHLQMIKCSNTNNTRFCVRMHEADPFGSSKGKTGMNGHRFHIGLKLSWNVSYHCISLEKYSVSTLWQSENVIKINSQKSSLGSLLPSNFLYAYFVFKTRKKNKVSQNVLKHILVLEFLI